LKSGFSFCLFISVVVKNQSGPVSKFRSRDRFINQQLHELQLHEFPQVQLPDLEVPQVQVSHTQISQVQFALPRVALLSGALWLIVVFFI